MTFARPVEDRLGQLLASIARRLTQVEQRSQVLDAGVLVCTVTGTIPLSYTTGQPTVVPAGQSAPIGPYPCLTSYTPHAGDRVLLVPLGQGYVIAGTYS